MSAVIHIGSDGLRPMAEDDLYSIMEIEQRVYPYPWTHSIFQDCLHVGYCCWIYQEYGMLLAYGIMSIGAGEAHILTLCVRPEYQRKGLGKMMLLHLLQMARDHKVETILLEVRPSNNTAVELYRKLGFNEVGHRHDYYPNDDGREDALIMALTLPMPGVSPSLSKPK